MQKRILSFIAAAALFSSFAVGCSNKKSTDSSSQAVISSQAETESSVEERSCSPVLEIGNVSGKPGEIVKVPVSVHGAEMGWAFSGVHVAYSEELEPVLNEICEIDAEKGSAVRDMSDFLAVNWTAKDGEDTRTDEMKANHWNSIFFCSLAVDNTGHDGDIVAFKFKIPETAEAGKVYDIEFFFMDGDMFTNTQKNQGMQEYAFSNWINGSITVEQSEETQQ